MKRWRRRCTGGFFSPVLIQNPILDKEACDENRKKENPQVEIENGTIFELMFELKREMLLGHKIIIPSLIGVSQNKSGNNCVNGITTVDKLKNSSILFIIDRVDADPQEV